MVRHSFENLEVEDHLRESDDEAVVEVVDELETELERVFGFCDDILGEEIDSFDEIEERELSDEEIDSLVGVLEPFQEYVRDSWNEMRDCIGRPADNPIVQSIASVRGRVSNCLVRLMSENEVRELVEMIDSGSCAECGGDVKKEDSVVGERDALLVTCTECGVEYPIPVSRLERFEVVDV